MQRKTVRVGIMSYEDYKKRTIAIAKGEYFLSSLPHEHVATAHKIPKVPISHAGFYGVQSVVCVFFAWQHRLPVSHRAN